MEARERIGQIERARARARRLQLRVGHRPWRPDQPFEQAVLELYGSLQQLEQDADELGRIEGLYRAVVDQVDRAIVVLDAELRVIELNREAERVLGWRADQVRGASFVGQFVPEPARALVQRRWDAALHGEPVRGLDAPVIARDGAVHRLCWDASRCRDARGAVRALVVVGGQGRGDSERLMALGRLAGGVAHDFNNLLLAIRARVDALSAERGELGELAGEVDRLRDAVECATAITRRLLSSDRRRVARDEPVDVNRVVAEAVGLARPLIGDGMQLQVDLADQPWPVRADRRQLERVVLNLLVNARDAIASGGGGAIQVSTGNVDRRGTACVEIAVRDTGPGIAEGTRPRIFDPFFTTKDGEDGVGLGLPTSLDIVRESGGWIDVDSEPGRGSVFRVRLPRLQPQDASEVDAERAVAGDGPLALLVEDDRTARMVIAQYLRDGGYQVAVAGDAEAALRAAATRARLDLLVTDLALPGTRGPELAALLRESHPDLKVVFISGDGDPKARVGDVLRARFVQKPFSAGELLDAARAALSPERTRLGPRRV